MSKNIFDRFECLKLDDEVSYYQCIKEQQTGFRNECKDCPEGREHKEFFRRQHRANKVQSKEAKTDMAKKVCPKCQTEAGSNIQRTCKQCGHEFFEKKIGGGKTVAAEKKTPKAKKAKPPVDANREEFNLSAEDLRSARQAIAGAIREVISPAHANTNGFNFELTIICADKAHALKILEVAMGYGADFGGWRVVA